MLRKNTAIGAAVAACTLALATGCSSSHSTADKASGSASGKTVCFVTATDSHPYVTPFNTAAAKVASASKVNEIVLSENFSAQTGVNELNTCIGRKPDAIMLWPLDPTAYVSGLARAKAAGIPVILVNTPMDSSANQYIESFTGPDTTDEGKMSADALNKAMGGKGSIVVIAGQAGNGTTITRTQGFTDELKALGSQIQVLTTVNANFDQQTALTESRDLITRYGSQIQGVYAEDDTMAAGFRQALQESGSSIHPYLVGINGQKDAFAAIQAGTMTATVLQSPTVDGTTAMQTIVQILEGKTVPSRVPITITLVNKDNVASETPAF